MTIQAISEGCPLLDDDIDPHHEEDLDDLEGLEGDYPSLEGADYPSLGLEVDTNHMGLGLGVRVGTGYMGAPASLHEDNTGVTTTSSTTPTPTPLYSRVPSVRITVSLGENLGGGGDPHTTTLSDQDSGPTTPHPPPSPLVSTPTTPLALVTLAPGLALTPMTPLSAPAQQLSQPPVQQHPQPPVSAAQMALAQVFDEIALQLTLQVERAVLEVSHSPSLSHSSLS